MENLHNQHESFMTESAELFQKKMIDVFRIVDLEESYDRKITGKENIANKLSIFSSLGPHINIEESRKRYGPDVFNSIKFDDNTKILQIGRHDADAKGNVTYSDMFSLVPKELFVHYCPTSEHCIMVLTNEIKRKLGIDEILVNPDDCDYCDWTDTETSMITELSNYVNPLLIYPKGSEYLTKNPYFLKEVIAKEELNSLNVKL